jgi:hypothetical protein
MAVRVSPHRVRLFVGSLFCGSEHYKLIANFRGGWFLGDDHGNKLRLNSRHEHREVQWHDGDDDYELECDLDRNHRTDGSNDRQRSGHRQWRGQQW